MSAPRPRSVTLACIYAGLTGAVLLMSFLDLATGWSSLEVQQRLETTFEQAGLNDQFDVETMLPLVRTLATIGSFLAMAVIVFAIFAARGDRGSRMGITVLSSLALVVFAASGLAGIVPAVLAVLVLSFLWSKTSREWFAQVNSTEPLDLASAVGPNASASANAATTTRVRQSTNEVTPNAATPVYPEYPGVVPAEQVLTSQTPISGGSMPGKLKIALAITGFGASVSAGCAALLLLAATAMRDLMIEEIEKSPELLDQIEATGLSAGQALNVMGVLSGVWLAAALFAFVAIGVCFSRKKFAWWLLLVALLLPLGLSIMTFPLGLVSAVPLVVVVVLVFRPDVRQWFM